MTNRGAFLEKDPRIYWFNQLNGDLTVFNVCVPRCVIPPLFHISLATLQVYDAHNPPS